MKRILLLLAAVGMIFTACEGGLDNEENGGNPSTPKIELSQQSVEVAFESAQYSVSVTSPYSWEATTKNDWIVVESETGIAGEEVLRFSTKRNEEEQERKGTITLKNTDYNLVAELYVTQKAFVPAITIEPETLAFAVEGGTQEVAVTTNFEYEFSTEADWLTIEKSEKGISVTAPNHVEVDERTAEITISSEKYGISKTIAVTQKGVSAESKNVILYTSSNGKIVTPYQSNVFGANIVSNTYENGKGVIKFDGDVTTIGDSAFFQCTSLTSVTIPDSVTSIRYEAFRGCASLTSITIPDSVTSIDVGAFSYCSSLTSITIPNSVTSIGRYAFCECTSLTSAIIGNGITSIVNDAFMFCPSLSSITIPDSVTSIGDNAFFECTSLTSVTIPDGVTSIGDSAFMLCTSLTSVTIPDSVTEIGSSAFGRCYSLEAFYGKFASADNRSLIVDGVLNSFAPVGLTEYTIPDSVTSIGDFAFDDCTSLTSVTIPNSVTSIGGGAFYGCTSLTSVTIPNSVTEIGDWAFRDCISLTSVYCKPTTPPTGGDSMFRSNASGRKIYVPRNSVNAYKAKQFWSDYKSYIEGYDF